MKHHSFPQGSSEWHAHRACSRNASDAPAVLGCSPYTTRTQLLHAMHTGIRPEVDDATQRRFDDGHAVEAAQLPGAQEIVGDDLYPVVGSEIVDGLALSASFDGLTMAEDVGYECKTLNDDLRSALPMPGPDGNDAANLPKPYRVQMTQQMMVSGAERVLFVAATKDGQDVRRCWYYPDAALRAEILAGWRQFDADLADYVPPAASSVEKIVAEPVEALPAPVIQVSGQLTLQDNFKVFEQRLRAFLADTLIREPKTDEDFVQLDAQIKAMKQAREALKSAEAQMLAQVQPVDQAKKTKDMLDSLLQQNCSMAERLMKDEKERRRGEIVAGGVGALKAHIDALNARLGKPYMPTVPADFGGCIKGLKSLASMEDKVATELARAKIAANEIADRIDANLKHLRDHAGEHRHLFPDAATIVLKAPDDLQALVSARIGEHKAAEERRAAELAERERERIRAEEQARADREARERLAAEQRQREQAEAEARQQQEAEAKRAAAAELDAAKATLGGAELSPAAQALNEQEGAERFAAVHPKAAPAVIPMPTRTPAVPQSAPTLTLGEIKKRLHPLSIDDAGLTALGFPPAKQEGAAKLRHESSWHAVCAAIAQHVVAVANRQKQAAA